MSESKMYHVKRVPITRTETQAAEFDAMFYNDIDEGYKPDDAPQVFVPKNDETPLERMVRERQEKYA